MDFESQLEKIAKDIRDREDREMALAFTNVVGSLLRENGVFVKTSRYELETDNEADKNKYIIKKEYGFSFDGLDFTEHDKMFKDEIASLKKHIEKLESIRTRCHESARDSFDLGKYGCLHIVTADELKNSNEKVAKIESELFDVQKSADEYYNKCIDLTNQIEKLKSELKTKDNIQKINLNETIKVKLTPYGAEIYYKQFDELNKQRGREICKPKMPRIDKDGYTEFQLWHFMELYGAHIGMCKQNVIKPLDIVYCKHNRED